MIDPNRVEEMFKDCLFRKEEIVDGKPPEGFVMVEGVINTFGLHPERLQSHKDEVENMLRELPLEFRENEGGGWSFLNACNTKDGEQWTGLHQRMDQLFSLGIGLGMAKFQLPRDVWEALPGGMPYIVIMVTD